MYNTKHWLIGPSEEERIKYTSILFWQILFVLTAETYPSMDQNNEDKQLFWHWRFLYTYGCLYSLVGYMGRLTLSCIRHFNRIKLQWHWSWPPEFKARCSDHDFYKYQTLVVLGISWTANCYEIFNNFYYYSCNYCVACWGNYRYPRFLHEIMPQHYYYLAHW